MLSTLPPPFPARTTKTHPRGQQQSKFQLQWKMPLIETKWVSMLFRLSGSECVSAASSGGGGGEKFLGQLFHYLPCALSGPGSQLWPRLAGTTIIITISHQTAPASAWPGEKRNVSLKLLLKRWRWKEEWGWRDMGQMQFTRHWPARGPNLMSLSKKGERREIFLLRHLNDCLES